MHARGAIIIIEDEKFSSYFDRKIRADFLHALRPISKTMLAKAYAVPFDGIDIQVVQTEDLIGLKVQAYHNNHRRLKDMIDIQELLIANSGKIGRLHIRHYFALFGRENEFDK